MIVGKFRYCIQLIINTWGKVTFRESMGAAWDLIKIAPLAVSYGLLRVTAAGMEWIGEKLWSVAWEKRKKKEKNK